MRFKDLILRNAPSVDPFLTIRVQVYDKYREEYSLAIDTEVQIADFVKPGKLRATNIAFSESVSNAYPVYAFIGFAVEHEVWDSVIRVNFGEAFSIDAAELEVTAMKGFGKSKPKTKVMS